MQKEEIDIYIECDSTSPKEMNRQYRYLLECRSLPGNTRSGGDQLTGTYNMATMTALIKHWNGSGGHVSFTFTAGMTGC
ncbi:hypothetical protein DXA98_10495 [Lachnospiraceae bacterium OF09-6]|nr:hypothetical protein DXA98_10495 [Lachnospiraceae bacterium OF09-6]